MHAETSFLRGLRAGIPIGMGYFSVSISFGLLSVSLGFSWWQALLISMTCVTSAGQFAGVTAMGVPGQYLAMLVSQVTINVRYAMMSVSLSQKADSRFGPLWRWLLGFFITDEIFAVAAAEPSLSRSFFAGLAVVPYVGWSLGTLVGALVGSILPESLMNALCVALYGMFVAIVVPVARKERPVLAVVLTAMAVSCLFTWLPVLSTLPSGLSVSICAIAAAALGALVFPVKEESCV